MTTIITDRERAQAAEIERLRARVETLESALSAIDKQCFSHFDGRDLFAQMHPRDILDIRRLNDLCETWFEGDWLTDLGHAIKDARAVMKGQTS